MDSKFARKQTFKNFKKIFSVVVTLNKCSARVFQLSFLKNVIAANSGCF